MKLTQKQKDALETVKQNERAWGIVHKVTKDGVFFEGYLPYTEVEFSSWRELYKRIRDNKKISCLKHTKRFSKRKNRIATNQNIHNENYDVFFKYKSVKTEDVWAWD